MTEYAAFISSVRGTYEMAKGIKSIMDEAKRADELSKLLDRLLSVQELALSLQSDHQELIQSKDEIAKKLMQYEKWSDTEKEYDLRSVGRGVFVYVYNKADESSKPVHWLCPRCWEERVKSILQCNYDHSSYASYSCPQCKTELKWPKPDAPPSPPFIVGGRRRDNSW